MPKSDNLLFLAIFTLWFQKLGRKKYNIWPNTKKAHSFRERKKLCRKGEFQNISFCEYTQLCQIFPYRKVKGIKLTLYKLYKLKSNV
jgi:hypothetical protein